MIITRKMADEAATVLELPAEDWTVELVNACYRSAAKRAHPDMGGSAEAFAKVDRAKHVLLGWLERLAGEQPAPPHAVRTCHKCEGRGHVMSQRAFRQMRVQCPTCRGTGDLDYEHEKEGSDL